jgi:hypothetical protein
MPKPSPVERNLAELIADGWWVAVGPIHRNLADGFKAVAVREGHQQAIRAGDTISEAVSILARDLRESRDTKGDDDDGCEPDETEALGGDQSPAPSDEAPRGEPELQPLLPGLR